MKNSIRLGLVGAGRWGKAYIKTIREMPGVTLALLCSRNPASRELVDSDCQIMADWLTVVTSQEIDGVILATPPNVHAIQVEAALKAGTPVMVEKPLTMNLDEALHLQRIAKSYPTPILVDHTQLFHPAYAVLKKRLASLGPIRFIRSTGGNWGPFRPDVPVLWDYAPHDVAFCLDLVGTMPQTVRQVNKVMLKTADGIGEQVTLQLCFNHELMTEITVGNILAKKTRRLEVYVENWALVLDDQAQKKVMAYAVHKNEAVFNERKGEEIDWNGSSPLSEAVADFIAVIENKKGSKSGIDFGVKVVQVLASC